MFKALQHFSWLWSCSLFNVYIGTLKILKNKTNKYCRWWRTNPRSLFHFRGNEKRIFVYLEFLSSWQMMCGSGTSITCSHIWRVLLKSTHSKYYTVNEVDVVSKSWITKRSGNNYIMRKALMMCMFTDKTVSLEICRNLEYIVWIPCRWKSR